MIYILLCGRSAPDEYDSRHNSVGIIKNCATAAPFSPNCTKIRSIPGVYHRINERVGKSEK